MVFDVYMIFITAFALFGAFCLIESIVMGIKYGRCSETVTIIKYNNERAVLATVEYLHNTLYNNKIIIVSDNGERCLLAPTVTQEELHKYITNDLFTKK